jgi:predicted RNA-binding Zn-ribbon protein involved in translation (DUF1610 family)
MAKDVDKMLEAEIGELGAAETEQQGFGKLTHKAAYGQKEDLNEAEQESLNKFLNRGKQLKEEAEIVQISSSWIPVDRESMGIRSMFYPEAWDFYVKPATMKAIKNWTAIDETRPDQVNKVFNEIIKQCVKIDTHDVKGAGWAQINSWDRFWFILKVREYTFAMGENKVEFTDECNECGQEIQFTLTADSLHYEFPDENLVQDYWNGKEWEIDPSEYDVDHEPIKLYTPKLGKDEAIIEWATNRYRNGGKLDETFIEFLVWLLDKPSRDPQMLERQIEKIQKEYNSWDVEMFTFMRDVIKNVTINPSENLSTRCPQCGQETISGVQFPDGITALFGTNKPRKKFGSR